MKQLSSLILASSLAVSGIALAQSNQAPNGLSLFTGDVRLACEAILCLSSGNRPSECTPSLKKYFSLRKQHKKDKSTAEKRSDFLNLCPTASHDESMRTLVKAIVHGAGNCDAKPLNATLMSSVQHNDGQFETMISNQFPQYCSRYFGHAYTDIGAPKYVGTPKRGGFWAEPDEYEAKKAEYDERIAREDQASSGIGSNKAWGRWSE